jgi:hypothetical protein
VTWRYLVPELGPRIRYIEMPCITISLDPTVSRLTGDVALSGARAWT